MQRPHRSDHQDIILNAAVNVFFYWVFLMLVDVLAVMKPLGTRGDLLAVPVERKISKERLDSINIQSVQS